MFTILIVVMVPWSLHISQFIKLCILNMYSSVYVNITLIKLFLKKKQLHSWAYTQRNLNSKNLCTLVFTAALFAIARTWKEPKCPSTEEWIKKMWHICTVEYHSAIRRNRIMPFGETWMDLETVIQSEVSQKEESTYRILRRICRI